jgi:hypothetical protein
MPQPVLLVCQEEKTPQNVLVQQDIMILELKTAHFAKMFAQNVPDTTNVPHAKTQT